MPAAKEALGRWPLIVVLALSLHLSGGIFGRGLWKPDEPREAAIAARMARPGADLAVPHLGDAAFCEKPPLYYWVAAGSLRLLGGRTVTIRLPNLVYALVGALMVGLLARAAAGRSAALAAGVAMGTLYLAYRVEIWIATDALLMASVAGALLGCYRGLGARRGWPKLAWYSVMHAFLAAGFLAKNVVAWIVPLLALGVVIAWERRWRELLAWELVAPLAIQAAAVLPWVAAVAARPEGAAYLRAFFLNNLVGRFTEIPGVGYTRSHPGSPLTYLVQLPVFLLPWTFALVAAAVAAWRGCSSGEGGRPAWRFAVASVVPGLVVLSASATARDIYAGVLMPGFAVLGGVWVERALAAPGRLDRAMVKATAGLVLAAALAVPPAVLGAVAHLGASIGPPALLALAAGWVAGTAAAVTSWRATRGGRVGAPLALAAAAWIVTWSCWAPLVFPVIDRAQDLAPVVRATAEVAAHHPVALWQPDETIVAAMDYEAGLTPRRITDAAEAAATLAASPDLHLLAEATASKSKEAGLAVLRDRLGLAVMRRVDLPPPGGRSYVILGPPAR
ncbi:MAG TPA: glycosyltransferase family 39 protein [Thermoanaerobaculaceae bacterium]|nr:glycosyltransferase family 39 protein [Thermoanaerobaculaceae bacterium]